MGAPFYWVDAFASEPFRGNAAGVCFLDRAANDEWMRLMVAEMSLSEIAFLWEEGERWRLRWFTPAKEVDLCGHATLATSHVIYESGRRAEGTALTFDSKSGPLSAVGRAGRITLDFPSISAVMAAVPAGLEALTGPIVGAGYAGRDFLVELPDAAAVQALDFTGPELLGVMEECLLATARSDEPGYEVVSRFFAPSYGVDEDPVTGSAHCVLGPYWAAKLGVSSFLAYQASARGGMVEVEVAGDRTRLTGSAITLMKGEILIGA